MVYRIIFIIFLIAVAVGYSYYQQNDLAQQLQPKSSAEAVLAKMPAAVFETLDGKPFSLDDVYKDDKTKLLVVHYWGTWCAPCEAELPELLSFIKRFSGQPEVQFLLIAVNDEVLKIQKHLKAMPVPGDGHIVWLLDNKNVHRDVFGTTRVPETYVFSSDKVTLRKYLGPQEWNKTMFFQTFDEFLQISTTKL